MIMNKFIFTCGSARTVPLWSFELIEMVGYEMRFTAVSTSGDMPSLL